jgi:hypothetical protein
MEEVFFKCNEETIGEFIITGRYLFGLGNLVLLNGKGDG